ncbi:hypothetical protein IscW_ISCW015116 [Ixodes scapularis]|uniref:Uncharacterized protein n=1 Tax=Ixodes scapularis TaxID=6945 RepID=B7QNW5_IXOSC|nr:hypothetical protein IscW_ISCW015116 [Ixodes scapularis]|eukprot:XP_002416620.1 hypothetical protein IscW_ISCW015116 [Ixodes scapularis]
MSSTTTTEPGARPRPDAATSVGTSNERALVCVVSGPPSPAVAALCSHLVLWDAVHSIENGSLSVNSRAVGLSVDGGAAVLLGLGPAWLAKLDVAHEALLRHFVTCTVWLLRAKHLDGIALFASPSESTAKVFLVTTGLERYLQAHGAARSLLVAVGLQLRSSRSAFNMFRGHCALLFYMTHGYGSSQPCKLSPPTPDWLTRDDLEAMVSADNLRESGPTEKLADESGGRTATCVSINLALMRFELVPGKEGFLEPCSRETWADYAEASPSSRAPQSGAQMKD